VSQVAARETPEGKNAACSVSISNQFPPGGGGGSISGGDEENLCAVREKLPPSSTGSIGDLDPSNPTLDLRCSPKVRTSE